MKFRKTVACVLAVMSAAAIIPLSSQVAAADSAPQYTGDFEIEYDFKGASLTDYAVYGDCLTIAVNANLLTFTKLSGGETRLSSSVHNSIITNVKYDADGELYFRTATDIYHMESNKPTPVENFAFDSTDNSLATLDDGRFYTLNTNTHTLSYWSGGASTEIAGSFSNLKLIDGTAYAVLNNVPHALRAATATPLPLTYTDFSAANQIDRTGIAAALKSDGYDYVGTATLEGGYCTMIDPDASGDTFAAISTVRLESGTPCLVIYMGTGTGVSMIATNDGCYITSADNVSPDGFNWRGDERVGKAYYAIDDIGVYSCPYMSEMTRIGTLNKGSKNAATVTHVFEQTYLKNGYYKIRYTDSEGNEKTGFVAQKLMTERSFFSDDDKLKEEGDKEPSYDTNVTTVVLAIVIVALVIIAVLYLALVNGKKKQKKAKGKNKKPRRPDPEETDYDGE